MTSASTERVTFPNVRRKQTESKEERSEPLTARSTTVDGGTDDNGIDCRAEFKFNHAGEQTATSGAVLLRCIATLLCQSNQNTPTSRGKRRKLTKVGRGAVQSYTKMVHSVVTCPTTRVHE